MLTVTVPAASDDLTTVETAKLQLAIGTADHDVLLAELIHVASEVVSDHCHRTFGRETVDEIIRVEFPVCDLILSRWPVTAVVTLTERGNPLAAADYELAGDRGILTRMRGGDPTFWSAGKVSVRYTAGYELLDGLPWGIERAVVTLVGLWFRSRERDPAVRTETVDGVRTVGFRDSFADGALPPEIAALLGPHRSRIVR